MAPGGIKKYRIALSRAERGELTAIVKGKAAAYRRRHAHILLLADEGRKDGGRSDKDIASVLDIGVATVERVRRQCVEDGLAASLERREQVNRKPRKLDGDKEAALIAIACSEPPAGQARWTLELVGNRMVELKIVDSIGKETVRRAPEKTTSSRG